MKKPNRSWKSLGIGAAMSGALLLLGTPATANTKAVAEALASQLKAPFAQAVFQESEEGIALFRKVLGEGIQVRHPDDLADLFVRRLVSQSVDESTLKDLLERIGRIGEKFHLAKSRSRHLDAVSAIKAFAAEELRAFALLTPARERGLKSIVFAPASSSRASNMEESVERFLQSGIRNQPLYQDIKILGQSAKKFARDFYNQSESEIRGWGTAEAAEYEAQLEARANLLDELSKRAFKNWVLANSEKALLSCLKAAENFVWTARRVDSARGIYWPYESGTAVQRIIRRIKTLRTLLSIEPPPGPLGF